MSLLFKPEGAINPAENWEAEAEVPPAQGLGVQPHLPAPGLRNSSRVFKRCVPCWAWKPLDPLLASGLLPLCFLSHPFSGDTPPPITHFMHSLGLDTGHPLGPSVSLQR